jgi:hypothetical protein
VQLNTASLFQIEKAEWFPLSTTMMPWSIRANIVPDPDDRNEAGSFRPFFQTSMNVPLNDPFHFTTISQSVPEHERTFSITIPSEGQYCAQRPQRTQRKIFTSGRFLRMSFLPLTSISFASATMVIQADGQTREHLEHPIHFSSLILT